MSHDGIDPGLLQDFLTESFELIEQLDADMVTLENADADEQAELLNSVFRALHTIKGAASFLGIEQVIRFAHAAEDALNKLRKGEAEVTAAVMDVMLRSVDVIRGQIGELNQGVTITPGPQTLIDQLHAIAEGTTRGADSAAAPAAAVDESPAEAQLAPDPADSSTPGTDRKLELPPQKADLLEFMVADLHQQRQQIDQHLAEAENDATRHDAAVSLTEITSELVKTLDFFELDELKATAKALDAAVAHMADLPDALLGELLVRVRGVLLLLDEQTQALEASRVILWPLDTLTQRLTLLADHQPLDAQVMGAHQNDPKHVLVIDGVLPGDAMADATADAIVSEITPAATPATDATATPAPATADSDDAGDNGNATRRGNTAKPAAMEATIRVEVGRLEELLNLVGQMVLTKNRILALGRKVLDYDVPQEYCENVAMASSDLDRLTGELQVSVMRTRMQPLAKLFDRYPRVIRDLARMTHKKINLIIEGKETEVDKSVLELLADPLVHILRNSADHGVEQPDARRANGKSEEGTIRLTAEHQGSHVRLAIQDDGKGIDREIIGNKAVEKGLVSAEALASMPDADVFRFIFAPGFSTAEQVSDLSGRGVGMDVVNSNVTKMNGQINITSKKNEGTTIEILIPLTVAIMPAMMVGIGKHLYAIPLQSIVEIVRPESENRYTIHGYPVMRLRDTVLPLVNMRARLNEQGTGQSRFAVVVGVGGHRAGLMVDRLIGQQEVVIKPLDDEYTQGGPFSGATIREDGDVSLILDVVELVRTAQEHGITRESEHAAPVLAA